MSKPLTLAERIAHGRELRRKTPRAELGRLHAKARDFDPLARLALVERGRLARLLPVRREKMSASPFAFYRGALAIQASDFARLPNTGVIAQLVGDAHLGNLGAFAAADGLLVFDFNDFDESFRGPFEWELKRMAASLELAGDQVGAPSAEREESVERLSLTYCETMAQLSATPYLEAARLRVDRAEALAPIHSALREAARPSVSQLIDKFCERRKGQLRLRAEEPLAWRIHADECRSVIAAMRLYAASLSAPMQTLFRRYRLVDIAFRARGVGSLGVRSYLALFIGVDESDALFLQVKEEPPCAYACVDASLRRGDSAQRVIAAMQALQTDPAPLIGATRMEGRSYLVRPWSDHKAAVADDSLRSGGLSAVAKVAGQLLARAHARTADAAVLHGYCGHGDKLATALANFAQAYAEQTRRDFELFCRTTKNVTSASEK